MKICMIVFSPSKNTLFSGEIIKQKLITKGHEVQFINLTGNLEEFKNNYEKIVAQHDMIILGGPVYVHHLHYNLLDLIKLFSKVNSKWGKYAALFVTYGGVTSGIALDDGGKALRKKGRTCIAGMKLSAPHNLANKIIKEKINLNKPGDEEFTAISDFVNRIDNLNLNYANKDISKSFKYQNLSTYVKCHTLFREKLWQKKIYPKLNIDKDRCLNCGNCIKDCPVNHLMAIGDKISINNENPCIHCFNCLDSCKRNAISFDIDSNKIENLLKKLKKHKDFPESLVYPILD